MRYVILVMNKRILIDWLKGRGRHKKKERISLRSSGVNLVWNLGVMVDPGQKNFDFSRQISENFVFFRQFHTKIWFFPGKFSKNFNFLGNFTKISHFPGKNWSFTAISGQIILFLFKSHHFRTYGEKRRAAFGGQKISSKDSRKNFVLSSKFSDEVF